LPTVPLMAKLLIPLALVVAVVIAAITVPEPNTHAKPAPSRSLQSHR
jgi:hypothetical protein